MSLLQEIWIQDVQEKLLTDNAFMSHGLDHSAFIHGLRVHVPQAGALPRSTRNRTGLPATAVSRGDTDLTYEINSRSTDPIMVPDLESFQLSYDKRQSVLQAHLDRLTEDTGRDIAYAWAPTQADRILETTGADIAGNAPTGATGTRKAVTLYDVARLAKAFDADNVPEQDRYLLMHPALYYELLLSDPVMRSDVMGRPTLPKGVIGQIYGFNVLVKNLVPVYTKPAGTLLVRDPEIAPTATATDRYAAIAWQKGCVARAISQIEVFENVQDATYYGSVISARIYAGAAKVRLGQIGTGALVQGA